MKKIAIFTEGQSELIFVRHLVSLVLGWDKISFKCLKLHRGKLDPARHDYSNAHAKYFFLIVNIGNDETVMTAVKDRERRLIEEGYDKIIALRDMYSENYFKRSPKAINDSVTTAFIDSANTTIGSMSDPSKIKSHFAIMELEAWFLGMHPLLERLNSLLTVDHIKQKLGFDLSVIDPQNEFFKPANELKKVLGLVGLPYQKSEHDLEAICNRLEISDFSHLFKNNKCDSFQCFYNDLLN